MDVQTGLVCVVFVILSGAILLFISMFGMREKTYEEAIAEQRKMPDDALLLGRSNKDKNREKKQKRQGKKVKEKPVHNTNNNNNSNNNNNNIKPSNNKEKTKSHSATVTKTESVHKENEHTHVNFIIPEAQVLNGGNMTHPDEKKKKKKEKIKPILLNKEEPVAVREKGAQKNVTVNHFTEIIPKDDLQLKLTANKTNQNLNNSNHVHVISNENSKEKEKGKEKLVLKSVENEKIHKNEVKILNQSNKVNKSEKIKNNPPQQHPQQPQQMKDEVNRNISNSSVEQSPVQQKKINNQQMNNKELKNKKQKKNDLSSLHNINESVNIQLLIPLIRKAELSRTEVQILTDILLTKHFDEVSEHFEWIEGRQDPVVKLKKQLAEKEKALAEEQEASLAFQNKLKELRSEYNAERTRLGQVCRQYDETILAKQGEIQNLHATNRHLMDSHVAEKQALTQKLQQLQAQINDETMVIRKLQEDNNQTQNALQQELVNQRQQMELHIARLSEQLQEAQKNVEAQIHAKIQEAEQIRASFNVELQKNRRYEEEVRELREQLVQSQNTIKSLESRASQLKESTNHSQELARQLEEIQRANNELEKRLLKSEEDHKFEKEKLQNEIHGFKIKMSEIQRECDKLMGDREKLIAQIAAKVQLEEDLFRLKEENQCLISQVSSFAKIEREAQQMREENGNLTSQVTAFTERPAADGHENGDSFYNEHNVNLQFINQENETKQKNVLIEKLEDELKEREILIEKLNSEITGCRSEISKMSCEIAEFKTEVPKLREELQAQRNKNDDLRKKNWKAMEVLTATEKSLDNKLKETEKFVQERTQQEQQASKELLERIFPDIQINENNYEKWVSEFQKNAKNYLEKLLSKSEEFSSASPKYDFSYVEGLESKVIQLEGLVSHYKNIIEDTEGMLNKLQTHVEQEEIRWRQKVETLEPQIQTLKENQTILENLNEELKSKVKELEKRLEEKEENNESRRLAEIDYEKTKKMTAEIETLNSKLAALEEENTELNRELNNLKNTIKSEQDAFAEENKKRLELEEELKLLRSKISVKDTPINTSVDFMASEGGGY